jgi:hypothetical protein
MLLFVVAGTAAWVAQSGIYRYATTLESLGALAVVLVAQRARYRPALVLLGLALLVSADSRRPHWGRTAGDGALQAMRAPPLGVGAMVVTATGDPLAYLALGLPRDVPLVGLGNNFMQPASCTALQQRASAALLAHQGPLWLLEDSTGPVAGARALLAESYGLAANACTTFANPLAPARVCRLSRSGPPRAPCLVSGETRTGSRP